MSKDLERLTSNLDRLLGHVRVWGADLMGEEPVKRAFANRLAKHMPLSHGTTSAGFSKICFSRAILSQRQVNETLKTSFKQDSDEMYLNTDNDVFLFSSIFRYPKSAAGFLYKAKLEKKRKDSIATPFDSGGLRRMSRFVGDQTALHSFLSEHELPVPEYRSYLEEFIALAFDNPLDFIQPEMPTPKRELWWVEKDVDPRRFTPEVRVREKLDIVGVDIEAVFLTRSLMMSEGVMPLIQELKSVGTSLYFIDQDRQGEFRQIQKDCFKHIRQAHGGNYAS